MVKLFITEIIFSYNTKILPLKKYTIFLKLKSPSGTLISAEAVEELLNNIKYLAESKGVCILWIQIGYFLFLFHYKLKIFSIDI